MIILIKNRSHGQAPIDKKSGVLTVEEKKHLEDSMRHNYNLLKQLAKM